MLNVSPNDRAASPVEPAPAARWPGWHRRARRVTDWIDLYQIHRPDPNTDIDETLAALTDLVQQGKVRYIGSSSFSAGQVVDATRRAIAAPALHPSDESRRVDAFGRALENRPGRTRGGA